MSKAKNVFTDWLERLQQESWQLELLISGFLLSMLFTAKDSIEHLLDVNSRLLLPGAGFVLFFLLIFAFVACLILIINLVVHILLRSLWIGAIGLRNVSGEIDIEKLNLSPRFETYFKEKIPSFDDFIERLENFCCLIFAFTFLIIFAILSFFVGLILTGFLVYLIGSFLKFAIPISIIRRVIALVLFIPYAIFSIIYFVDFLSLGKIKQIAWLSKFYMPFYRFFSLISLSSIYRPLYYNMLDNPLGRKVMWSILPYLGALIIYASIEFNESTYFPEKENMFVLSEKYEDNTAEIDYSHSKITLNKKYLDDKDFLEVFYPTFDMEKGDFHFGACIQSVPKNELGFNWNGEFHVGYSDEENKNVNVVKHKANLDSLTTAQKQKDVALITCFASHFEVMIGDSLQQKVNYDFYQHPKSRDKGILATVDIMSLARGKHFLHFRVKDSSNVLRYQYTMPFWKK